MREAQRRAESAVEDYVEGAPGAAPAARDGETKAADDACGGGANGAGDAPAAQSPRSPSRVFARFSRGSRDDGAGVSGQKREAPRGRRSGSAPPTNSGAPPSGASAVI